MDIRAIKEKILFDPILAQLSALVKEKKVPLFLVGGFLRDLLLGTSTKDYDFTLPQEASSFIPSMEEALRIRFFTVGKEDLGTLTYRVIKGDNSLDLTFLQGAGIDADLQRRDFTINAIAFSLLDETFHWVEGALEDMEGRVIRAASRYSIDRDPLRMLRAIRYLCTLDDFALDKTLKNEISQKKELARKVPGERVKMELDRILLSPRPSLGMRSLHEVGLLFTLLPEFRGLENLGQNEHHHLNVISHIFLMIEKIAWAFEWVSCYEKESLLSDDERLTLYYAALFHDLGKQDTYSHDEKERVHFYYHEAFSSQRADGMMERLRFSNAMRNRILRLVKNHMRILNLTRETKEGAFKRLVNQMGQETPLLVLLTLADKEASRGIISIQLDEVVEDHCLRILKFFSEKETVQPSRLISGHDVMALGYSGPKVGQILNFIREKQIEGEIKTKEDALAILMERYGFGPRHKE